MNPQPLAQIINPILDRFGGSKDVTVVDSGNILAQIIVTVWRTLITLGGLAVFVFLIMGAINWLTAGGDKAKVEAARDRITNAIVGMAILFASVAIVDFIGPAIGFDILDMAFPDNSTPMSH